MVTRRRGLLGLIATGLAAVLVPSKYAEVEAAPASQAARGLEGTWVTTFTATGAAGGPQRVHVTFNADGTVIVTTSAFPRSSPAQGVWEQTGEREFIQTHVHLRYDDQGTWVGLTKVRLTITLNETM